jgi:hypothetical protein
MDSEARLLAALGANAAPARDPRFTLAVMKAAEADRFKVAAVRSMLFWGAMASATAVLAFSVAGWSAANWDGVQSGILGAGGIFALVATARLMTQRLAAVTTR